jgi:hypothetical protein
LDHCFPHRGALSSVKAVAGVARHARVTASKLQHPAAPHAYVVPLAQNRAVVGATIRACVIAQYRRCLSDARCGA